MKTVEKPATKPRHARMTCARREPSTSALPIASTETPEIKDRYAGIKGITHGEKTEIKPDAKASGICVRNSDTSGIHPSSARKDPARGAELAPSRMPAPA